MGEEVEVLSPKLQHRKKNWPAAKAHLEKVIKTRTREEWCKVMEYTDICFAPVLTVSEAFQHPHAKARGAFIDVNGVMQAAPAPRFSNTPASTPTAPPEVGADTVSVLRAAGADVDKLLESGIAVDRSGVKSKL